MSLLLRGLKLSHLRMIAELRAVGQVGTAADRLHITQSAASRLLTEIEQIIGAPIRRKDGRGVQLTEQGHALARRAERILLELQDTQKEISELNGGTAGHVRIGSVTGPAIEWVLPALRKAAETANNVTFDVEVGPSDVICEALLAGEIDMAVARVIDPKHLPHLDQTVVATEPMSLIVASNHPLLKTDSISAESALDFDWVLPAQGSILRRAVETRIAELGLTDLSVRISTSSIPLTLAHVRSSAAIAPMANSLCDIFGQGDFAILPLDLGIDAGTFSLLTRKGAAPTPAAALIRELIASPLKG